MLENSVQVIYKVKKKRSGKHFESIYKQFFEICNCTEVLFYRVFKYVF